MTKRGSIDSMIDAGIKAADLYQVSNDDVITRSHLRRFLEAAIASGALVPASAGQPFDKIKAGLEEAVAVAKGEQPAASIYVHGHKYVPASAVAAERERCAAIIQAECDRILSKQTPTDDPFSDASAINSNLRMMAVVLPDLVEKLRSPAPASGEFVVVPRADLQVVVDIAGRNESAIEIECIKEWLKDAATKDGERG